MFFPLLMTDIKCDGQLHVIDIYPVCEVCEILYINLDPQIYSTNIGPYNRVLFGLDELIPENELTTAYYEAGVLSHSTGQNATKEGFRPPIQVSALAF